LYERSIHQLDLCILAYQLYAQTLLWPMDPFSEEMARKRTHRRETFMAEKRRRFEERRVPSHLDPILTDPARIDPHHAALFKPESTWTRRQRKAGMTYWRPTPRPTPSPPEGGAARVGRDPPRPHLRAS
jgi:hypothetical protein